jgi:hypothetical protein
MAGMVAGVLGRYAYEKSGAKNVVHSIPIVGDIASIFGFQKGGMVPQTGPYLAHKGELVVPASTVKRYTKRGPTKTKAKGKAKASTKRKGGPKKGVIPPQFRRHLAGKKKKH